MPVLVDTSVWIEYFKGANSSEELDFLIDENNSAVTATASQASNWTSLTSGCKIKNDLRRTTASTRTGNFAPLLCRPVMRSVQSISCALGGTKPCLNSRCPTACGGRTATGKGRPMASRCFVKDQNIQTWILNYY
jgi:hypothetical protein